MHKETLELTGKQCFSLSESKTTDTTKTTETKILKKKHTHNKNTDNENKIIKTTGEPNSQQWTQFGFEKGMSGKPFWSKEANITQGKGKIKLSPTKKTTMFSQKRWLKKREKQRRNLERKDKRKEWWIKLQTIKNKDFEERVWEEHNRNNKKALRLQENGLFGLFPKTKAKPPQKTWAKTPFTCWNTTHYFVNFFTTCTLFSAKAVLAENTIELVSRHR